MTAGVAVGGGVGFYWLERHLLQTTQREVDEMTSVVAAKRALLAKTVADAQAQVTVPADQNR